MKRRGRFMRWVMIVGASGLMPAFIMRCDKAALNFQRGLFWELGTLTAQTLFDADLLALNSGG